MKFFNIGRSLNLPSQECYNIIQDQKGYIWICTENGLCKYNGKNFKIFNKTNGLPEGGIYFIHEDKKGVIWLITSKNRILKLTNDSIIDTHLTSNLKKLLVNPAEICYLLNTDENDNLIINSQDRTYIAHPTTLKASKFLGDSLNNSHFIINANMDEPYLLRNVYLKNVGYDYHQKNQYQVIVKFVSKKGSLKIPVWFNVNEYPDFRQKICKINNTCFYNIHNRLIKIDENLHYTIYTFPSKILSISKDKKNGLCVGLFQKGLYYYKDIDHMQKVKTALEEYSVTGTCMDREGGMWCATLEKDIFYCNNPDIMDYSNIKELQKRASLLKSFAGKIYISTQYDQLICLEDDSLFYSNRNYSMNTELTDIINFNNITYLTSKGKITAIDKNTQTNKKIVNKRDGYDVGVYQMDTCDGSLYALSSGVLGKIEDGIFKNLFNNFKSKTKCLLCVNNQILIGCSDRMYKYDIKTKSLNTIKGIHSTVTKIIKTSNNKIFVATKSEGLFTVEDSKAKHVHLKNKESIDFFTDIEEDKDKNIWAASNKGLLKIKIKNDTSVYQFNSTKGLLSDNILQIAVDEQKIYISTPEGLSSMPLNSETINKTAPTIFLDAVIINNKSFDHKSQQLIFPHNENSLIIKFDALSFKNGDKPVLIYKFKEQDDSFKVCTQNELVFDNLESDTYELIVYAINNDGVKSIQPVIFNFEILKPFWKTGWFILICILISGSLIFFIVTKRIQDIRLREEEKTRIGKLISESQLSALQAQMNPHFIFNAINSIQNYILKNNEKEAYNYLAKFSKLIRMVLNNSRENILSLYTELETLRIYIELEQLRFENSFEFKFIINKDIDEDKICIPTMLIQPYVENAIWHGLMNLDVKQKGVLKIEIQKEKDVLKIVVEDNGVGRAKTNSYKNGNLHNPIAMKLTEQRLSIIKKMDEYEKISVTIIDLHDSVGASTGTRIELFLPLIEL